MPSDNTLSALRALDRRALDAGLDTGHSYPVDLIASEAGLDLTTAVQELMGLTFAHVVFSAITPRGLRFGLREFDERTAAGLAALLDDTGRDELAAFAEKLRQSLGLDRG